MVLLFAWSNTLVSSHSIRCCCPQACSAMADFSVSPSGGGSVFLYAGLESSLHLPYIHMAATARDLVHNFRLLIQRVLVLDSCQLTSEGGCRSEDCSDVVSSASVPVLHLHSDLLHRERMLLLRLLCWLSCCVGPAVHLYKGLRISVPFQYSSEVVLFNVYSSLG